MANGQDIEGVRKAVVNAIFLGGTMSFNNAGLGYVHSMAHQLAWYITCHMVSAAMLLPAVERKTRTCTRSFRNVAKALGLMLRGKQTKNVLTMLLLKLKNCLETVGIPEEILMNSVSKKKTLTLTTFLRMLLIDACAPEIHLCQLLEETIVS